MHQQLSPLLAGGQGDNPILLAVAFLLWVGVGVFTWRSLSGLGRSSYAVGGLVLAYYETHMTWAWFGLGVLLVVWPLVFPSLRRRVTGDASSDPTPPENG